MGDKKIINEGYEKKGGVNPKPDSPKPIFNVPPQKPPPPNMPK
jgi:hypothetical protein